MATTLQFAQEVSFEAPAETAPVRVMARFFFASFWTIVFTGAIRKWIFPGASILYLTQDVPILFSYMAAIYLGLYNRGVMMLGVVLLSAIISLQGMIQIIFSGLPVFIALVGLHNYLFYLPMLVVFPLCLTLKYRTDFVRWNMWLSLPMVLLAVAQARAPKFAFINRTSEGEAFGVSGSEVARVTGTFNFSSFYGMWVAMAVALCMGEWLLPKERRAIKNQWLLIACTFAVNLCHLVAASRSAIALAMAGVLGAFVAAILLRSTRAILALGFIAVLLPVAAGATYLISPDEFNIVKERFTGESYAEDTESRLQEGVLGFMTEPKFSFIGAGVGLGVDAAHIGSTNAYNFTYSLSENDLIRTVMELGTPIGLTYALTRIFFGGAIILLAMRLVRAGASPHVLPLSFFMMAQVYQGDLTRSAAMTASQSMVAFSFILGVFYYPDIADEQYGESGESLMRYA